jgi:hypothetical protein
MSKEYIQPDGWGVLPSKTKELLLNLETYRSISGFPSDKQRQQVNKSIQSRFFSLLPETVAESEYERNVQASINAIMEMLPTANFLDFNSIVLEMVIATRCVIDGYDSFIAKYRPHYFEALRRVAANLGVIVSEGMVYIRVVEDMQLAELSRRASLLFGMIPSRNVGLQGTYEMAHPTAHAARFGIIDNSFAMDMIIFLTISARIVVSG